MGSIGFPRVFGMAFANGVMYGFATNQSRIVSINLATGHGTLVTNWSSNLKGVLGAASISPGPDDDSDGDGLSNSQEILAGTNPNTARSALRIISTSQQSTNLVLSWTTAGGRTNVIEAAADASSTYSNISPNIIIPGSGDMITNYLHSGGATNVPARFYRIRLVP